MQLKINILIYSPSIIEQSLKDFARIAKITIRKKGKFYFDLNVKNLDPKTAQNFKNEYFNYLLGLQINLNAPQC